ncbi:hypothetical protein TNCV_2773001 [Trichonephila clavipes]|nr:hypothetical protein TNCV_2773001 [Trichonephila clavipes]
MLSAGSSNLPLTSYLTPLNSGKHDTVDVVPARVAGQQDNPSQVALQNISETNEDRFMQALQLTSAKYRSSFGIVVVTQGATCAVTSTHITIILESLPKPGDDTLGDSMLIGYFQLGTSTFQSSIILTT